MSPSRHSSRGRRPDAVVIPFPTAGTGLWAAQREWMIQAIPLRSLGDQVVEELDRAELELKAVEDAIKGEER